MLDNTYDIFISYRRIDSEGRTSGRDIARTIKLELEKRGYKVFFDYSEIKDNEFENVILPAVKYSKIFILILSKDALLRCSNEGDWVRREILTAIKSDSKIIPVSPDNAFSGWPQNFPEDLEYLKRQQISEVSMGSLFEVSIEKLEKDRIINVLSQNVSTPNHNSKLIVSTDETSLLYVDDKRITKIKGGKNVSIPNIELGRIYSIRLENLSRRGEIIEKQYNATGDGVLTLNFSDYRRAKEMMRLQERKAKEMEKEEQRKKEAFLKNALENYDKYYIERNKFTDYIVVQNRKLGYVSENGLELLPCLYDEVSEFSNGFASVKIGNDCHIIDRLGNIIQYNISETLFPIYHNYVIVEKNDKFGVLNVDGTQLIQLEFDNARYTENEDIVLLKKRSQWQLFSLSNNKQIGNSFQDFNDRYYDQLSGNVYTDEEYYGYRIYYFPLKICINGLWGLMDADGRFVIPCAAKHIEECLPLLSNIKRPNLAIVQQGSKFALVNQITGEYVIPPIYDFMQTDEIRGKIVLRVGLGGEISDKYKWEEDNSRYDHEGGLEGIVDLDGKELVPIIYNMAWACYYDDDNPVLAARDDKRGYFDEYDRDGNLLKRGKL